MRAHHDTVRTVARYRQLTPATPATLLTPTFLSAALPGGLAGRQATPDRSCSNTPLSVFS